MDSPRDSLRERGKMKRVGSRAQERRPGYPGKLNYHPCSLLRIPEANVLFKLRLRYETQREVSLDLMAPLLPLTYFKDIHRRTDQYNWCKA
jgi:hypothetical protein